MPNLNQGVIYGVRDTYWEVDYYGGVPYATPPVDSLRWKPTLELESFSDLPERVFHGPGVQHNSQCMQFAAIESPAGHKSDEQDREDCLVLNIYRPANIEKNLPVAIWIHGGGLQFKVQITLIFVIFSI